MNRKEIENALKELIIMYQAIENEYGINLTREVDRVNKVIEDIPEAIWKAEVGKNL